MRVLVTGAAGFIGSHLVEALLDRGHEVTGLEGFVDNYPRRNKQDNLARAGASGRLSLHDGLVEEVELEPLLRGQERVFHLAALPGVRPSWGSAFGDYLAHNVLATQRLLEACTDVGVPRVVYASSSSVYGDVDTLPMREDAREKPYSPYGVTKLAGEQMARLYARNHGLQTTCVRYFTVYGPRQRPDMAIQRFLTAVRAGRELPVFGDGEQTRDFTYVADAVEATLRAAERGEPGGVYNVGGGSTVTVNELIAAIREVTGASPRIRREDPKPGDVRHTRADCERARAVLGFVPATPLQEGLARQWEWLGGGPSSRPEESPETDR